jgi:hypothetical protein
VPGESPAGGESWPQLSPAAADEIFFFQHSSSIA